MSVIKVAALSNPSTLANKIINGTQMTVIWHIDDLKISHVDSRQVDKFIEFLKDKYEDTTGKLKISRGKIHKYLGMTINYSVASSVKINMT